MGSVTHLSTTGDNDPEIFQVRYYRHYLYCDRCGSFELDSWIEPGNPERLAAIRRRLGWIVLALLIVTAGFGVLALSGPSLGWWLSLAALAATLLARAFLVSKERDRGLRCAGCGAGYEHESGFFTEFEANPRKLTMSDVPRPLYRVHQIRGKELGPAEDERSKVPG